MLRVDYAVELVEAIVNHRLEFIRLSTPDAYEVLIEFIVSFRMKYKLFDVRSRHDLMEIWGAINENPVLLDFVVESACEFKFSMYNGFTDTATADKLFMELCSATGKSLTTCVGSTSEWCVTGTSFPEKGSLTHEWRLILHENVWLLFMYFTTLMPLTVPEPAKKGRRL